MKIRSHNYKNFYYAALLVVCDAASYLAALPLAYGTRLAVQKILPIIKLQFTMEHFVFQLWWILFLYLVIIAAFGLYTRRVPFWKEARDLAKASSTAFLLAFAVVSMGKMSEEVSRLTVVLLWAYSTIFLILFRYVLKSFLSRNNFFTDKTVIVGDPYAAEKAAAAFSAEKILGLNIEGAIVPNVGADSGGCSLKILGSTDDLEEIIRSYNITAAVLTADFAGSGKAAELAGRLQLTLSKIILIPETPGLAFSNAETQQTIGTQISYFQINNNLKSPISRFLKRTSDLILCVASMPVVLPVTLIIGAAVKLTSDGPVFYSHKRVGRNGRTIGTLKFRSMYKDAASRLEEILKNDSRSREEWEKTYKLKNDPRVTPVGRFLRKTSLDELPQIFNVIKGDMSLIGPRPVLKEELEKYYGKFAPYYLMVRPGITGLWQISGRSDTDYDFRVSRDAWYVLNWSPWLDLVILLRTPGAVLGRRGAY